jgi:hypothetical protein
MSEQHPDNPEGKPSTPEDTNEHSRESFIGGDERPIQEIPRSADTSSRRASDMPYIFIDNTSRSRGTSEAVRVHVMRHSHRARRQGRDIGAPGTPIEQMMILDVGNTSSNPTDITAPTRDLEVATQRSGVEDDSSRGMTMGQQADDAVEPRKLALSYCSGKVLGFEAELTT